MRRLLAAELGLEIIVGRLVPMLANDPQSTPASPYVDLSFPLSGSAIPFDHGYPLYAAISRLIPEIHDLESLSVHPICGQPEFPKLKLSDRSRLCLRLPADIIPLVYFLAGKTLVLEECRIFLGLPECKELAPSPILVSRLVAIKGGNQLESFCKSARTQLDRRSIPATIKLAARAGGEAIRRVLKVKGKTIVGYGLEISPLSALDSIALQESGIGGRHKMGCGVFVPV